jgi:predicted DNA-binding protein (MmcQ/YjbR family)
MLGEDKQMDRNTLRDYCLSRKGAAEEFPFGVEVAVFKVMGKVFALLPVDGKLSISLKCDPTLAEILRQNYAAVTPGYHLNKRHWNSVLIDDTIPLDEIFDMIDHSYEQVINGMTKKERDALSSIDK